MRVDFERYKTELEEIKLTQSSKKTLVRALTEYEPEQKAKRPLRPLRMALIAAAMILCCALMLAAGWMSLQSQTGVDIVNNMLSDDHAICPVEVRDGRVWLAADGREMDITGLFDEQMPYIYLVEDTEGGIIEHIVVGGTLEDWGYMDVLTGLERINDWPCAIVGKGASLPWGQYNLKWKDWAYTALEEIGIEGIQKDLPEGQTDQILAMFYFEVQ